MGRNYVHQINETAVTGVFEGRQLNRFMGNSGTRQVVADYYGDVFDHSDLDFIGGAWLDNGGGEQRATEIMTAMRPDQVVPVTSELEPGDLDQGDNHPAGGTTMGTDPAPPR